MDENGLDFDEIVYEEPVEDDRKVRPIFRDQPAHAGSAGSFRRGENYAQNTFYEREEEPYEEPSYEEEMPYNGETYEEGTAYEGQEYEEQPVYDGQDAYGQPAYGGQALYEEPVYEEPAYEEQQVYDDSVYNGEIIYEEPEGENYYSEEAPEDQADFGQTRVMYADRDRSRSKREIEDEILENEIYYQEEEEPVRPSGARAGRQAHAAGPQRGGNRKPSRQAYRREEEEDDRRGGGGLIDAIIALTGIAGVVLAVVIGIIYFQSKNMEDPAAQFANVGTHIYDAPDFGLRNVVGVRIYHVDARMEARDYVNQFTENAEVCPIGTVHYGNDYKENGRFELELIQAGGVNTFTRLGSGRTRLNASDFFMAGSSFTMAGYSQFFDGGVFDTGADFGYRIDIVSITGSGEDARATVRITRQ